MRANKFSMRKACKQVVKHSNVSAESIRTILKRQNKGKEKAHGNRLLTDDEELEFCGLFRAFARNGTGLSRRDMAYTIGSHLGKPAGWSGQHFLEKFLARNKAIIKMKVPKALDSKRVTDVSIDDIEAFIAAYQGFNDRYKVPQRFVINADESPVLPQNVRHPAVAAAADATKVGYIKWGNDPLRTIIPFLGADGTVWMIVMVFARTHADEIKTSRTFYLHQKLKRIPKSFTIYYASTEKGYVTKDLWADIMEKFVAIIKPQLGGSNAILLLDHLASHEDAPSLSLLLKNNIHAVFFPPHSSHIVQPADNAAFATLKRHIFDLLSKEVVAHHARGESLDCPLQSVIIEALRKSLTRETVIASFEKTGMFPFDPAVIRKNASGLVADARPTTAVAQVPKKTLNIEKITLDLLNRTPFKKKSRGAALPMKNRCFLAEDIISHKQQQEEQKKQKEKEKELKANVKNEKKRQREADKAAKAAAKILCKNCSARFLRGKAWWVCPHCNKTLYCPKCKKMPARENHEDTCDGEGDN
jgi:hypothetical protein